MIATTLASLALLVPLGFDHPGRGRFVPVPVPVTAPAPFAAAVCNDCGAKLAAIDATIARLQRAPDDDDREDAAEDLRGFRPRCHPEVVMALADSLGHDRDGGVRREAAESLGRMGAPLAEARLALSRAAAVDPNPFVRQQAKKGLAALSGPASAPGPRPVMVLRSPIRVPIPFTRRREIVIPGPARVIVPSPTPFDDPIPAPLDSPATDLAPAPVDEPRLRPIDPPDDVPPPRPELVPSPSPSRSIRSTPAVPPPSDLEPLAPPAGPVSRRSSARPVLPPIETPMQVMPAPRPIPLSSPNPVTTPAGTPPLEGPVS